MSQARAPAVHNFYQLSIYQLSNISSLSKLALDQAALASEEEPGHPEHERKKEAACFCGPFQRFQYLHNLHVHCLHFFIVYYSMNIPSSSRNATWFMTLAAGLIHWISHRPGASLRLKSRRTLALAHRHPRQWREW